MSLADIVDHVLPIAAAEGRHRRSHVLEPLLNIVLHEVFVRNDSYSIGDLLVAHVLDVGPQEHLSESFLLIQGKHSQRMNAHSSTVFFMS